MFFDAGISLGCIVLAVLFMKSSNYVIHISPILFGVGFFSFSLSLHEYYLMKCNKNLMRCLIGKTVNLIDLQKALETRDAVQEKTSEWFEGLKGSIESAHLICRNQSAFLIIVYSAGSSAIPKRVADLQKKLDAMDNDIKVYILHAPNDGKAIVPDEVFSADVLKYSYQKDSSKWVSVKDD